LVQISASKHDFILLQSVLVNAQDHRPECMIPLAPPCYATAY